MKNETVEEYIARGGKVERLPYVDKSATEQVKITAGNNTIISMEECFLYNGEKNKRKKSKNTDIKVDTNKIPADLLKSLKDLGVNFSKE